MMNFPATNFHDLNLDWVLKQIKTLLAAWQEMQENFNTLQSNFETLQDNFDTLESRLEAEETES